MTDHMDNAITRKIEALLAQANHPNTGDIEAQAFAAAAERLMIKHSIDEAMLAAAGGKISDIVDRVFPITGSYAATRLQLLVAVCSANRVKIIRSNRATNADSEIHVIGATATLDAVATIFASLQTQMVSHLRRAHTPTVRGRTLHGAALVSWRRQYLFGWTAQVGTRLAEQRKLAETEATAEHGPGVGLVLVSEAERTLKAFREMYPNARRGSGRTTSGRYGGRDEGRADGARADIGNRRLTGGPLALGGGCR